MTHDGLAYLSRGMSTARWIAEVPPRPVRVAELLPIQAEPERSFWRKWPRSTDPVIHVVSHAGRLWIEDGHHRYYDAKRAGSAWILARVLER